MFRNIILFIAIIFSTQFYSQKNLDSNLNKAEYFYNKSEIDSSIYYLRKVKNNLATNDDLDLKLRYHQLIGAQFYVLSIYDSSYVHINYALGIAKKNNFENQIAKCYQMLSNLSYSLKQNEQAYQYSLKSLTYYYKIKDTLNIINSLEGVATSQINKDSMVYYLDKAILLCHKIKDDIKASHLLGHKLTFYLATNNFNNATIIENEINKLDNLSWNGYNSLALYYINMKRYDSASQKLYTAINLAHKNKGISYLINSYHNMAGMYDLMGKSDSVAKYLNNEIILKDSLDLVNQNNSIQEKKSRTKLLSFIEETKNREITYFKKKMSIFILSFLVILIAIFFILKIYTKNKSIKKDSIQLVKEYSEREKLLRKKINEGIRGISNIDELVAEYNITHPYFIKSLINKYPQLSKNDIKIIVLETLNISLKKQSDILNITLSGVEKARSRLRKKLNIEPNISLNDFLNTCMLGF